MDDVVFNRGMKRLGDMFSDYECSPDTIDGYRDFLSHLSNQDFELAVRVHISKHKWFPKVSELLDVIRALRPTALDAWNFLIKKAEAGEKPEMDAAMAAGLDAVGGWEKFKVTSYKELSFNYKAFAEVYERERDRQDALPVIEHRPGPVEMLGGPEESMAPPSQHPYRKGVEEHE